MSKLITPGELAPDFELDDIKGNHVKLSSFRENKSVVLAFLRGFMWPYCRAQLARLRDEYEKFTERGAEILAVGPNTSSMFEQYWKNERLPFIGLPDEDHSIARMYKQEVNLFKLGRMPLSCIVDRKGFIRFVHYGASMRDIPSNAELLHVIDELNASSS